MYKPHIDKGRCKACGLCGAVCPVNRLAEYDGQEMTDYLLGEYRKLLCVRSKDGGILQNAVSGGFVTQLVTELLRQGAFESAFLVEGHAYDGQVVTKRFTAGDDLRETSKSRYVTVFHRDAAAYMLEHPQERIILVGTGCVVQGLHNMVLCRRLRRENYLFIGLFCDKTMNEGVVDYFRQHPCGKGKRLQRLYFRTKEAGGWPGNMKLEYSDGSIVVLDRTERMRIKEYFQPERCLYCLDKLNRYSDIAVGDNYIGRNADGDGWNSCIIRTKAGQDNWERCVQCFLFHEDSAEELKQSQQLAQKQINYRFAEMKGLYGEKSKPKSMRYRLALHKRRLGLLKNAYRIVNRELAVKEFLKQLRH